jgi:hypothetical protein
MLKNVMTKAMQNALTIEYLERKTRGKGHSKIKFLLPNERGVITNKSYNIL